MPQATKDPTIKDKQDERTKQPPKYKVVFHNDDFTSTDFAISLFYNFVLWFTVELVFHWLHPVLRGPIWVRSLKSYMLMALFFCSLAAIYMNHYSDEVKSFYLWSMVDALILFPLLGLANGVLYPRFFQTHTPLFGGR